MTIFSEKRQTLFGIPPLLAYICRAFEKRPINDFVAQLVEQYTFNVRALGSNPSEITESQGSCKKLPFFVDNFWVKRIALATSFIPYYFCHPARVLKLVDKQH